MLSMYEFFKERTWDLTEKWYANLDHSLEGVYSLKNESEINQLKEQNHQFHVNFCELFNGNTTSTHAKFNDWLDEIAKDQSHLNTPLDQIIGGFLNVKIIYHDLIQDYVEYLDNKPSHAEVNEWNQVIRNAFKSIIQEFSKRHLQEQGRLLQSQQEMITELSSPVILIKDQIAILPLVGDIDTYRAKIIFDKTLKQCNDLQVEHLVIDLSGVPIIDTMVANQIFHVISGLELIGTETSLSGMRPEIAQTAVQLGIRFNEVKSFSSLSQALSRLINK
ncbi:anti-anti-sigma regulatory factor [Alkalihalophilus pseudofirmus OF4]|uniref:Anti-anti-sigma regulatory factor n=2 Tax=Bacillaceae TaxID=186817 RepID=D3FQ63_ALKPO|nr:STAS domain-containing protein [Alkalihalophilus pseudofirmus]ADC51356.1 anti-anti-sigma regulatory factor [Alkalihalophilus pseudofirmus OF4]